MEIYCFNHTDISIKYLIDSLLDKNAIVNDTTIVSFGGGSSIISLSNYLNSKDIKHILIVPDDIDKNKEDILVKNGADLIKATTLFGYQELIDLAKDISLEIEKSYFLNLLDIKLSFKVYINDLKKIINNYSFDNIIIPIGSGIFIRSVSIYFKINTNCNIIGVSVKNKYKYKLSNLDNEEIDCLEELNNMDINYLNDKYPNSLIILEEGKYEDIEI